MMTPCASVVLSWLTVAATVAGAELTAFEGRIRVSLIRGAETDALLYTAGPDRLRIENVATNWPHPVNIVDLKSGAVTLVFPHNRSFVRLKNRAALPSPPNPRSGLPAMPPFRPMPPGVGPQTALPQPLAPVGPTNLPGMPTRPQMSAAGIGPQTGGAGAGFAMPVMPMMPMEQPELKASGQKTNLFGFACEKFELKQRGEVMEIWATDKLPAFQSWLQNQPPHFGSRIMEEQWPEMLKEKKLFPLLVTVKFELPRERSAAVREAPSSAPGSNPSPTGTAADGSANTAELHLERYRFEVKSIAPEKIKDPDGKLFQPPPDYHELEPLPF